MASWQQIKNTPVPAQLIFYVLAGGFTAYFWATSTFMTVARAADLNKQMTEQIRSMDAIPKANTELINLVLKELRVGTAIASIDRTDRSLQLAELTPSHRQQLQRTKEKWRDYKKCLIDEKPNCELLKPTAR